MTKSAKKSQGCWYSRQAAAALFGVTVQGFDVSIRPLARDDEVCRDGRRVLFNVPPILKRWAARKLLRAGACPCCRRPLTDDGHRAMLNLPPDWKHLTNELTTDESEAPE